MYAARVSDRDLTFVVSGMLWQHSLVMKDVETGSLWSHLLGRAMQGPLRGAELATIPSTMTDWQTWQARHPNTTVLNLTRTSPAYRKAFYRDLSKFVVGMAAGGDARAWPFDRLVQRPVLNDEFQKAPVLVVFLADSATAVVYDCRVHGRTLTFVKEGDKLLDRESGSQWDAVSGKAMGGPLQGTQLDQRNAVVSYLRAWRDFYPQSSYWKNN